jgi:chromosomal replication initiation ATPase DnaA
MNKKGFLQIKKTINKLLSKSSIKDVLNAVSDCINNDPLSEDLFVDFVISKACEIYNISKKKLIISKLRGDISECRNIVWYILYSELGMTYQQIGILFNSRNRQSVFISIKRFKTLNVNIKQDKVMLDNYQIIKNELSELIKNNENKNKND